MQSQADEIEQGRALNAAQIREYRRPLDPGLAHRFHDYQCRATGARGARCRMSVVARISDFEPSGRGTTAFDPEDPRCLFCARHLKPTAPARRAYDLLPCEEDGQAGDVAAEKVPARRPFNIQERDEIEAK